MRFRIDVQLNDTMSKKKAKLPHSHVSSFFMPRHISEAGHTKLPLSFCPVHLYVRRSVQNLSSATPPKLSIGLL